MTPRNHIKLSAIEIKQAIEKHKNDVPILKELLHEATFRKKAAKTLSSHVKKAQEYIDSARSSDQVFEDEKPKVAINPPKQDDRKDEARTNNSKIDIDTTEERPERSQDKKSSFRGQLGSIRDASTNLKGLPQVWSPQPEVTFEVKGLKEAATNSEKFKCALGGLIWEIRKSSRFSKTINLTNGKKEHTASGEYGFIYVFTYLGDEEFFEGASIAFKTGRKSTNGSIVSMVKGKPTSIVISLEEDFGATIQNCSITQDEAALLEALQKRYEAETGTGAGDKQLSPVGMNSALADALVQGKSEKLKIDGYKSADISNLNAGQSRFVGKAISHSISFLWGPPGTGKTQSLGAIVAYFFGQEERTLVCSNTNQAVDQVLLKLCREMKKQGRLKDLEDGKIVRVGRISQKELSEEFSEYVTVDGIAERKGAELSQKISGLESSLLKYEKILSTLQSIMTAFAAIDNLEQLQLNADKNTTNLKNKINSALVQRQAIENNIEDLKLERDNYGTKGFLAKTFSRGMEAIELDLRTSEKKRAEVERSVEYMTTELTEINAAKLKYPSQIIAAKKVVKGKHLETVKRDYSKQSSEVSELKIELKIYKKQIEELRKTILSQAITIGATLTKSFLSPSELGKFENIVIDEASMGLLPAVYFTASQSTRRCVISGDFRQLPPIIQSTNKAILDLIGIDVFAFSGMEDVFIQNTKCAYAGVLTEQYRMDPMICDLISEIGYDGSLFTSKDRLSDSTVSPKLFGSPVIIVDTSPIYPFTDRDPFGSTSNIMHALIARNIMRHFGVTDDSGNIGYCAPFKAQTKLIKKMVAGEDFEDNISIGTVHTFQGDEKNTIIFDTVNSLGEKHFLNPNLAQESASKSNLLTVGISRAQHRLIFIANLRYLDTKIPAMGYLRKILYAAQTNGKIIDAREIIDLSPIEEEVNKTEYNFQDLEITPDELKSGLVNEDTFFPLLKQDLKNAKKYIAIYSGFYTPNRVNDLLPILLGKISSGIKIRIILPPPSRNGSMSEVDSQMVTEKLEVNGILVEFRAKIHQKAVLIDNDIAWFGSLNPLSFSGATEESMLRIEQKDITGTFAANMAVNRNSAKEDPALMITPELPACSYCGKKVFFNRGKFGVFVECISCNKKQSLKGF